MYYYQQPIGLAPSECVESIALAAGGYGFDALTINADAIDTIPMGYRTLLHGTQRLRTFNFVKEADYLSAKLSTSVSWKNLEKQGALMTWVKFQKVTATVNHNVNIVEMENGNEACPLMRIGTTTKNAGNNEIGFVLTVKTILTSSPTKENRQSIVSRDTIQANVWYHVAGMYDSTASPLTIQLYIDGQLVTNALGKGADAVFGVREKKTPTTNGLLAGEENSLRMGEHLVGELSDPRYYSKSMTADQMQAVYATSSSVGIRNIAPPASSRSPSVRVVDLNR